MSYGCKHGGAAGPGSPTSCPVCDAERECTPSVQTARVSEDAQRPPDEHDIRAKARELCIRFGLPPEREDTIVDTFEPLLEQSFYAGVGSGQRINDAAVRTLDAENQRLRMGQPSNDRATICAWLRAEPPHDVVRSEYDDVYRKMLATALERGEPWWAEDQCTEQPSPPAPEPRYEALRARILAEAELLEAAVAATGERTEHDPDAWRSARAFQLRAILAEDDKNRPGTPCAGAPADAHSGHGQATGTEHQRGGAEHDGDQAASRTGGGGGSPGVQRGPGSPDVEVRGAGDPAPDAAAPQPHRGVPPEERVAQRTSDVSPDDRPTAAELLRKGGEWLGAARKWLQWNTRNGDSVTWSSGDLIEPQFSVRQVEDLAAEVAAAAMRPQPSEERLSQALKARWNAEAELARLKGECTAKEKPREVSGLAPFHETVEDALHAIETWDEDDGCPCCLTRGGHGHVWDDDLEKNVACPVEDLRRAMERRMADATFNIRTFPLPVPNDSPALRVEKIMRLASGWKYVNEAGELVIVEPLITSEQARRLLDFVTEPLTPHERTKQ